MSRWINTKRGLSGGWFIHTKPFSQGAASMDYKVYDSFVTLWYASDGPVKCVWCVTL